MSSYSSTSLSSYDPASSSSDYYPTTPSTSPSSSPPSPSPFSLNHRPLSWKPRSKESLKTAPPPLLQRQSSQRNRTLTLDVRPRGLGVDPHALVGKQLTRVRRSRTPPCTTLQFSDGSAYQILVVGYDPHYPGLPKVLESDSPILNPVAASGTADVRLTISHATAITLSDKAFQVRECAEPNSPISPFPSPCSSPSKSAALPPREDRWTQRHAALALKFEEEPGWHCVWATIAEYDGRDKERCVFRNYADVYLDGLRQAQPAPPMSAPAHVTANPQLPVPSTTTSRPAPPTLAPASASGQQKGAGEKGSQKSKRKGGKRKSGAKGRW